MLYFFVGYARGSDDIYVRKFFDDLCVEVRLLAGLQPGEEVGFLDSESIESGDVWAAKLVAALSRCRTFVPLCSSRFFQSEPCGRQWAIFEERIRRHEQLHRTRPSALIPLRWLPSRPAPDFVSGLGYFDEPQLAGQRANSGVRQLMRLARNQDEYLEFISRLAARIVDAAHDDPLEDGPTDLDWHQVPSAFPLPSLPPDVEFPYPRSDLDSSARFSVAESAPDGEAEGDGTPPLPYIRRDTASEEDLIGISDDVRTLASLIAAQVTQPPLAVALLGEWGAGKSTLMTQVRRRVQRLADSSRRRPEESSFVANVRQVTFNAWHYSDDQLWTGLIAHLFDTLAKPDESVAAPTDPAAIREDVTRLREERAKWKSDSERISKQLAADKVKVRSPIASAKLLFATAGELLREVRENSGLLLLWAAAAVLAYASWLFYRSYLTGIVAAVATVVPALLLVWKRLRAWHAKGIAVTDLAHRRLQKRLEHARTKVDEANSRIAELDAAERLSRFLDERRGADTYQQRRGLLGQVHEDLDRLSTALADAGSQWRSHPSPDAPPLERIVLYIDDLDRCPPRRVVEVLAAVHLMLALPLFVVVVAVDSRWLLSSLGHHYGEMFTSDSDLPLTATPIDYLDKIFQIPYAVTAMDGPAASRFVTALLNAPEPLFARRAINGDEEEEEELADANPKAGPVRDADLPSRPTSPAATVPMDRPDLRPPGLVLDPEEAAFLAGLAPLISTPRAAKKVVNLYRLVRIGIPGGELSAFIRSRTYRVVQCLLIVMVASPAESSAVFEKLLRADPSAKPADVLDGVLLATIPEEEMPSIDEWQAWCGKLARFSFHTRQGKLD
ncbi:TIR-like protein FxsC [Actinoplanes sp. NPDC026619]|uniref:TIR-like protein FxsC n=1 Tax=Actinoplanes sp. NPDC026619 TaxID=3155798 RepID=UPI0033D16EE5